MGRGKIEIKRIESSSSRQVTFNKRKKGILKKAEEITILTDAKVSLIINSSSGQMDHYCSGSQETLLQILDRYQTAKNRLWDAKHESLANEVDRVKKDNDAMQVQLRHLKAEDVASLTHKELGELEQALESGLASCRNQKMEFMEMRRGKLKAIEDDNEHLKYELHKQEIKHEDQKRDIEYHRRLENFNTSGQLPFSFRNLHGGHQDAMK